MDTRINVGRTLNDPFIILRSQSDVELEHDVHPFLCGNEVSKNEASLPS